MRVLHRCCSSPKSKYFLVKPPEGRCGYGSEQTQIWPAKVFVRFDPLKKDSKAKYVLWTPGRAPADTPGDMRADTRANTNIEVRFVPYDIARTAARIMEVGLPTVYADRLW